MTFARIMEIFTGFFLLVIAAFFVFLGVFVFIMSNSGTGNQIIQNTVIIVLVSGICGVCVWGACRFFQNGFSKNGQSPKSPKFVFERQKSAQTKTKTN